MCFGSFTVVIFLKLNRKTTSHVHGAFNLEGVPQQYLTRILDNYHQHHKVHRINGSPALSYHRIPLYRQRLRINPWAEATA